MAPKSMSPRSLSERERRMDTMLWSSVPCKARVERGLGSWCWDGSVGSIHLWG